MKKVSILVFSLALIHFSNAQDTEIRAVIDRMFSSMYKGDTNALRSCFTPDAILKSYSYDVSGLPRIRTETLTDFTQAVVSVANAEIEEKLTGWQCLVDDGIATVWTPYEFYFNKKFSHCGVNSFQLMKVQGEWKITMITDTRRKKECVLDAEKVGEIDSILNQWHHAAAVADEDAFFGAMTEDGIYIGTDASERWLRDELKTWSAKYFERETAWDFKPLSRNVNIGPGGQIAWMDELLDTWMGTCRSTGILIQKDGLWKIVHYQLSIAVPNEVIDGYRSLIGKD